MVGDQARHQLGLGAGTRRLREGCAEMLLLVAQGGHLPGRTAFAKATPPDRRACASLHHACLSLGSGLKNGRA
jgi:hypothetical protein